MEIDEAVKILQADTEDLNMPHKRGVREAEKLGLEALKDLKNIRQTFPLIDFGRLPGETEK